VDTVPTIAFLNSDKLMTRNIFLNEYAVQFGVPLPGRLPNHGNVKVTLLPFDKANADIHEIYQKATKTLN
jgi:hypothetical protein